ncbi:MAG: zinc-binding dehydrogenase [Chloroflexi bacterium]|nr:MAG: zinc-binding dehydrogenase [Chloroflexota bacterium]
MRAAVCYEFGQPLVVEDIAVDAPQAGEVLVRMAAAGICHSDIHLVRGEWEGEVPVVAGHEGAGVVEAVGPGVTSVAPGDPVVVSLLRSCGQCFYCQTGSPYACDHEFALDVSTRLHSHDGAPIKQGISTACFAEYAVVEQSQLAKVPQGFPLECAALLACGVITGLGAVVNTAQVLPGRSVVVIGVGGVGLNSVQGAHLSGAYPIIAVDTLDGKLEAAREFGATHGVNATAPDAIDQVRALTGGKGADYVFVTVGSATAAAQGLRMIRPHGTLTLVGMPPRRDTFPLNVYEAVARGVTVKGSSMGSTRLSVDIPRLVALYQQGRLKLDELITTRYPFERINDAIVSSERGEALRNVVVFQ